MANHKRKNGEGTVSKASSDDPTMAVEVRLCEVTFQTGNNGLEGTVDLTVEPMCAFQHDGKPHLALVRTAIGRDDAPTAALLSLENSKTAKLKVQGNAAVMSQHLSPGRKLRLTGTWNEKILQLTSLTLLQ